MPLNPVQTQFVGTSRQMIERLIRFRSELDAYVLQYANQQTPVPVDGTVLDDNPSGTGPRADAPQLTGTNLANLNTFCTNMRGQLSAANLDVLVRLSVRSVEAILRTPG